MGAVQIHEANLFGIDYRESAATFTRLDFPIIDIHSHINGVDAAILYKEVRTLFGVTDTFSMTALEYVPRLKDEFGDSLHLIAMPRPVDEYQFLTNYSLYEKMLQAFQAAGSRVVKFWSAPRGRDYGQKQGDASLLRIDSGHRRTCMRIAHDMGMTFMVHVGDPDTWFQTKYQNIDFYGTKPDQYSPLAELLAEFPNPWIAAHMGGWPEDLGFLSRLLETHQNLYLDTSATKWMVRELGRHSREELLNFLSRWKGRILFGSDIVTADQHLEPISGESREAAQQRAFDLYASRYWALRTLLESNYRGHSPIADPDLALVEPSKYSDRDSPMLLGKSLPLPILRDLYYESAKTLFELVV